MNTYFKKHYRFISIISLLTSLFITCNVSAKPASKKSSIDIAMLDLQGLGLIHYPPKNRTNSKNVRKVPVFVYPSNCMTWNKQMIANKSKTFDKTINQNARKYNIDSNLIRAVITAESCFKIKALSSAGAQGLMQLIPDTAARFGVKNSYDPKQNIRGGVKYLQFLMKHFKRDLKKVIAAYNAGEGKVDKFKGIPPYKETQQYVKNVLKVYDLLSPNVRNKRVKAVYQVPKLGLKPGRHGLAYNRKIAPHLYKK